MGRLFLQTIRERCLSTFYTDLLQHCDNFFFESGNLRQILAPGNFIGHDCIHECFLGIALVRIEEFQHAAVIGNGVGIACRTAADEAGISELLYIV